VIDDLSLITNNDITGHECLSKTLTKIYRNHRTLFVAWRVLFVTYIERQATITLSPYLNVSSFLVLIVNTSSVKSLVEFSPLRSKISRCHNKLFLVHARTDRQTTKKITSSPTAMLTLTVI